MTEEKAINSYTKRVQVLRKAEECVCGKRTLDYGSPEDNFKLIASLWTAYMGPQKITFTPVDVAMMMTLLKVARVGSNRSNPSEDNFVDIAGYAACGGEIADKCRNSEVDLRELDKLNLQACCCGKEELK